MCLGEAFFADFDIVIQNCFRGLIECEIVIGPWHPWECHGNKIHKFTLQTKPDIVECCYIKNSNVRTPNKLTLVKSKADVRTYHKHRAEASGEGNLVPGTVWISSDLRTVGSLEKTEGCVQKGE